MGTPSVGYAGAFYLSKKNAVSTAGNDITIVDPSGGELDFASDASFSVEAWVAPQSDISASGELVSKGLLIGDSDVGWILELNAGNPSFRIRGAAGNDVAVGETDVANDVWVHLVGVRDVSNDRIRIYTDAILKNESTLTATDLSTASDVVMGDLAGNATRFGIVRIYSTALTDAQVSDLWKGNFPGAVLGDLSGEWMLHTGSGTNAEDSSSNNNDGVIGGSGAWVATTYDTSTSEALTSDTGVPTVFRTANENVDYNNLTVTVGGTAQRLNTDFTITPKGTLTFATAPGASATVATYRYYPMTVELGGFTSWSVDVAADVLDTTDFRSTGWRTFKGGLKGWTGGAERYWINPVGFGLFQKEAILRFYSDEVAGNYLTGWGIVNGVNPNEPVDALVTEPLTFQGTLRLGTETT